MNWARLRLIWMCRICAKFLVCLMSKTTSLKTANAWEDKAWNSWISLRLVPLQKILGLVTFGSFQMTPDARQLHRGLSLPTTIEDPQVLFWTRLMMVFAFFFIVGNIQDPTSWGGGQLLWPTLEIPVKENGWPALHTWWSRKQGEHQKTQNPQQHQPRV